MVVFLGAVSAFMFVITAACFCSAGLAKRQSVGLLCAFLTIVFGVLTAAFSAALLAAWGLS